MTNYFNAPEDVLRTLPTEELKKFRSTYTHFQSMRAWCATITKILNERGEQ